MTTWAIGDVQGCATTLERLLSRIRFEPGRDRMLCVGDLVNRGPRSLDVLRWARGLGGSFVTVLGNHDLRLLGLVDGVNRPKRGDTLDAVLEAPDRDVLVEWLASRPLLHREGDWLLVHAGLFPAWSVADAEGLAREVEAALREPAARRELLQAMRTDGRDSWEDALTGMSRLATAAAGLTRLRTCTADGVACERFSGPPRDAPAGCVPWFDVPRRRSRGSRIVFGHWAALGLLVRDDVVALDSGCVWGNALTAFSLDDGSVVQERAAD